MFSAGTVDPALIAPAERVLATVPEVAGVDLARMRRVGHLLRAEVSIRAADHLAFAGAHEVSGKAFGAKGRRTNGLGRQGTHSRGQTLHDAPLQNIVIPVKGNGSLISAPVLTEIRSGISGYFVSLLGDGRILP